MKRLILMRHAKTEPWTEGVDDHGRGLMPSGREEAKEVAHMLRQKGWRPDLVLASTARRTRETLALLSDVLPECDFRFNDDLYLATDRGITDILDSLKEAGCIMLIGHNPGLHDLCIRMVREGGASDQQAMTRLAQELPTGAAALFETKEEAPFATHAFSLAGFINPRDLSG